MKKNRALVVYIIDASTSMSCRRDAVVSAVSESIDGYKSPESETLISIYTFASSTKKVLDFVDVNDSPAFEYAVGGMTALYDAMGFVINDIGSKLNAMLEVDRPSTVQIMIITDGQENNSSEYTAPKISEMVKHQTEKYSWLFTYLGSNQDAILAGNKLGIDGNLCATYTDNNFGKTVRSVSAKLNISKGMDYSDALQMMSYSALERESLVSDDNR